MPRLPARGSASARPEPTTPLPQSGQRVEAILLAEKTKKGGWRAQHIGTGIAGPIQNSADVPADKQPNDQLVLIVVSANPREIAFRYPTPADEQAQANKARRSGLGKNFRRGNRR